MDSNFAVGLFLGTMLTELGDHVKISCKQTGYSAEIDFKTKGFFTGTYNAISGKIKRRENGKETLLYTLSGKWTDAIYITDVLTGLKETFLDISALKDGTSVYSLPSDPALQDGCVAGHADSPTAPHHLHKKVPPFCAQSFYESRQLWLEVTQALEKHDYDAATTYKSMIEEDQRLRKVCEPVLISQTDVNQLASLSGLDPTPIKRIRSTDVLDMKNAVDALRLNKAMEALCMTNAVEAPKSDCEETVYRVLVDEKAAIPLVSRFFQSQDGLYWSFKYFSASGPTPTPSLSLSAASTFSIGSFFGRSSNSKLSTLSKSPSAENEPSLRPSFYDAAQLSAQLQNLFHPDASDDYMDRCFYLCVK
jgi:hypothetical protein